MEFYWNQTGVWEGNGTQNVSERNSEVLFNRTASIESTIAWNCLATDSGTNEAFGNNFSVTFIDIEEPVIIPANPANNTFLDKRQSNQTLNYSITDNVGILNTTWVVYNSSETVATNDIVFNTTETSQSVFDIVDLTNVSAGDYFIGRVAYDTSGNVGSFVQAFTIIDFDSLITLISPENNTELEVPVNTPIEFNYQVPDAGDCSFFINDSLTQNDTAVAGINTVQNTFSQNQTISWMLQCTINAIQFNSSFNVNKIKIIPKKEEQFQVTVCPFTNTASSIGFLGLMFIIVMIGIAGMVVKIPVVTFFAGLMMVAASVFLFPCSIIFGAMFTVFGLVMSLTSLLRVL